MNFMNQYICLKIIFLFLGYETFFFIDPKCFPNKNDF